MFLEKETRVALETKYNIGRYVLHSKMNADNVHISEEAMSI